MKQVSLVVHFNFADGIKDVKSVAKNLANAIESHIDHSEIGIASDEVNDTYTKSFNISLDGVILQSVIYEL